MSLEAQYSTSGRTTPSPPLPAENAGCEREEGQNFPAFSEVVGIPSPTLSSTPALDGEKIGSSPPKVFHRSHSRSSSCGSGSSQSDNTDSGSGNYQAEMISSLISKQDKNLLTETSGATTFASSPSTACVNDARRRLVEQQYQHTLEELERSREAYQTSLSHTQELHTNLQQLRTDYNAQLHRYSALTERMSGTEKSLSLVETALVRERKGNEKLLSEKEEEKRKASKLQVEIETLERRLREAEAREERWRMKTIECETEMGSRYIPAADVTRLREEFHTKQHLNVMQPLQQLLQSLTLSADASETKAVVTRSRALSASRAFEDELSHTKATITILKEYWTTYYQPLESQTTLFMERVVKENTSLYQRLTELQRSYSSLQTTLEQRLPLSESVPVAQYRAELAQLERRHAARLKKAQELLMAQTTLIREHEETIAEFLNQVQELKALVKELQRERDELLSAKTHLGKSLEQTRQEMVYKTESIQNLEQSLKTFHRDQLLEWVPRQEKEECERKVQTILEQLEKQQNSYARLEQQYAQSQKLLEEANRENAEQQLMLTSEKENFVAQQARWTDQTQQLQAEHNDALQRIEGKFDERVAELEKERKLSRERETNHQASLQRLQDNIAELQVHCRSLECSRQLVEEDREELRKQLEEVLNQKVAPLEAQRASLEKELYQIRNEKEDIASRSAALSQQLREETQSREEEMERMRNFQEAAKKDLEKAEIDRLQLQQHLGKALCNIKDLELEMDGDRASGVDRASLLKENQRLQLLLQAQSEDAERSHKIVEQQRAHMQLQEELQIQVKELQRQLLCLPPLQEALGTLESECHNAKSEVLALQQERDSMAARLESILQWQAEDELVEENFNQVLKDATEVTKGRERVGKGASEKGKPAFRRSAEEIGKGAEGGLTPAGSGKNGTRSHSSSRSRLPTLKNDVHMVISHRHAPSSTIAYHHSAASRALLLSGAATSSATLTESTSPFSEKTSSSSRARTRFGSSSSVVDHSSPDGLLFSSERAEKGTEETGDTTTKNMIRGSLVNQEHINAADIYYSSAPLISSSHPSLHFPVGHQQHSSKMQIDVIQDTMHESKDIESSSHDALETKMRTNLHFSTPRSSNFVSEDGGVLRSQSAGLSAEQTPNVSDDVRSRSCTISPLRRPWKA